MIFQAKLQDKSVIHSKDSSWKDLSQKTSVLFNGKIKVVHLSNKPLHSISVEHRGLETSIDIPKGHQAYYAIKAETSFTNLGDKKDTILGTIVGLVKDGKVVEERFLDLTTNQVVGIKL